MTIATPSAMTASALLCWLIRLPPVFGAAFMATETNRGRGRNEVGQVYTGRRCMQPAASLFSGTTTHGSLGTVVGLTFQGFAAWMATPLHPSEHGPAGPPA